MAAPSDNSRAKNFDDLSNRTGEGVVIDLGTGDGRFVSRAARENPRKFYIGIDASAAALARPSMKATRKAAKGGLPNALFVQAAAEALPSELDGAADEIHVHFPWGSLLRAVACGDDAVLEGLRRVAAPECLLEIIIGLDETRDRTEIERLGLPALSAEYLAVTLVPRYEAAGFALLEKGVLAPAEWARLETSWARRLQNDAARKVVYLVFRAA